MSLSSLELAQESNLTMKCSDQVQHTVSEMEMESFI
jgi:hypothetical protein